MRLDSEKIYAITGRKRPRSQAAWFREYLGTIVPCDRKGPILTECAYEALVAKALGIFQQTGQSAQQSRPFVRLIVNEAKE